MPAAAKPPHSLLLLGPWRKVCRRGPVTAGPWFAEYSLSVSAVPTMKQDVPGMREEDE